MQRHFHISIVVFAGLLFSLPLAGCGDGRMQIFPVRGSVRYQGKPAGGAEVQLFGLDEKLRAADAPFPKAEVQQDGTFTVYSYQNQPGAPAGNYRMTVVWRQSDSEDPEERDSAPDLLRGKYADPKNSPLTIEIKPIDNELPPLELE